MDSYPNLGVRETVNYTSKTPSLVASEATSLLWQQVFGDTKKASEFNQAWRTRDFDLGDEITQYNCFQDSDLSTNAVTIVCRGQVRLLAFDAFLGKEVSIQLLDANQIFGGDSAFCNPYGEYRAVASSKVMVLQISLHHLDVWLQDYPALFEYFSQITQSRQKLIFFKTLTELRSQNTPNLQKILPYFIRTEIIANSPLRAKSHWDKRFWLASGEITSISGNHRPPNVGESWGYPKSITTDLISRTDLSLFYLPKQHFEAVEEVVGEFKSLEVNSIIEVARDKQEDSLVESNTVRKDFSERELTTEHPEFQNFDCHYQNSHPPRSWLRIYPFIQQQTSSDCGAACLAMISQYWGKRFNLNTLRSIAYINSTGAEFFNLVNAAQSLGYQAVGVRGCLNQLKLQPLPWIAHYQGNHYIVVWQIKNESVLIADPAIGKKWVSYAEFEANFTGYALLLSPTENFYTQDSEKISFARFYQFFGNNRLLLIKITLLSILLPLLAVVPAILIQNVVDKLTTNQNFDSINILALGFLVFGFGRIALTAMRQYVLDDLSNRLDITLIGDFIGRTLQLPLSFFASRKMGDILNQIHENPKIHQFLTRKAAISILDGLMTVIYFGLMANYSWELTLVVVSFISAMMGLNAVASLFLRQIRRKYAFDSRQQNSLIIEMLTGITTIKTAGVENSLRSHWEEYFTQMIETRKKGQNVTNILQMTSSLINHLGTTTVLWYGTEMVMDSQITLGEFIAFNIVIGNALNPILALVKLWDEFPEVLNSIEKLDDILVNSSTSNSHEAIVLPPIQGEVCFENVSCNDKNSLSENDLKPGNILENISFKVKPGETIAIVGCNHSQQKTIANLLSGSYPPDRGRILIDGCDIRKVCSNSLKSQLATVTQEFFLFSGTVLENITLYNREFSLEQVQAAAKLSGAHAFIQTLPFGYSTIVGEGGMRLNTEQKQKIALTRALIKNPRILLLYEGNNSINSLNSFNNALKSSSLRFHTTFIITSSFTHNFKADTIFVFDQGLLVDRGTHEELITKSTLYRSLIE